MADDPTCETCRWWQKTQEDRGECRRRAPQPLVAVDLHLMGGVLVPTALWPLTLASDWCGEWAPARVVQGKGGGG